MTVHTPSCHLTATTSRQSPSIPSPPPLHPHLDTHNRTKRDPTDQQNKYGYQPFISSPSGCHPPLSTKRLFRNPYFKYHPYHTSTPELRGLLEWCPPFYVPDSAIPLDQVWKSVPVYEGSLPWSDFGQGTRWTREKD